MFPHDTGSVNLDLVRNTLKRVGLTPNTSRAKVAAIWERKGSLDSKHVEVWDYNGKRVDLFFLR